MKYAYCHWRREFRGEGEENCSGVLVWQLNDIWPGTSWALVDVNLNRKMAFYSTKRALGKVGIGMQRVVTGRVSYMVTGYLEPRDRVEIWAVSSHLRDLETVLKIEAFDIETGERRSLPEEERERSVLLKSNGTTEIGELDIAFDGKAGRTAVLARLVDRESGEVLARWVDWPEPLKFVIFKKGVNVNVEVKDEGGKEEVWVSTDAPVKGVVLSVDVGEGENEDAVWEDNFVDLVPGEVVRVGVEGLRGRKVKARWLCDWEQEEGFEL